MDLVGRARGFLILREGLDFCDACLGRALGVSAARARSAVNFALTHRSRARLSRSA